MKRPSLLLKVAVVVSSLLLGVGFVGYRAGAFHWLTQPATPPADSQNNPTPAEKPSDDTPPTLIYGTKSSYVFQGRDTFDKPSASPAAIAKESPPATAKEVPPATAKEAPPVASQRPPTLMGGSKYAPVFVSPTMQRAIPDSVIKNLPGYQLPQPPY